MDVLWLAFFGDSDGLLAFVGVDASSLRGWVNRIH